MSAKNRLSYFHDPRCSEYEFRWQAKFSAQRKALGPYATADAQRYISKLRFMRRTLNAGDKPSLLDFRTFGRARPENFIQARLNKRFRRAIDKGETQRSLARRGFFGSLKEYRTGHCS